MEDKLDFQGKFYMSLTVTFLFMTILDSLKQGFSTGESFRGEHIGRKRKKIFNIIYIVLGMHL